MKISLVGPTYPFRGGISHYTTVLAEHISGQHDLQFLSFSRQYPKWLFPGKSDIDPSLVNIKNGKAIKVLDSLNPFTWLQVIRLVRSFEPDLLIIPWWVTFWAPQFWVISYFLKTKTKILFICHNVVEHEANWLSGFLSKLVLKNGDSFIVHSQEDRQNLETLLPGVEVTQCHHPTYDIFKSVQQHDLNRDNSLGISGPVLLFFGFVREYKGLKYLLAALPEALAEVEFTLLVVGEFWKDKAAYLEEIDRLNIADQVVIVDEYIPNEQVGQYFNRADLVVQPYVSATGSGVVQIAYGFEKPVLATKVGCLPQVIDDGQTGYLVEPASSAAIAHAIVRYFKEGRQEEFAKNIRQKSHIFSWEHMVNKIADLGNKLP